MKPKHNQLHTEPNFSILMNIQYFIFPTTGRDFCQTTLTGHLQNDCRRLGIFCLLFFFFVPDSFHYKHVLFISSYIFYLYFLTFTYTQCTSCGYSLLSSHLEPSTRGSFPLGTVFLFVDLSFGPVQDFGETLHSVSHSLV